MYFPRKLKPDRDITGFLPAIVLLTLFILVLIVAGIHLAMRVLGFGLAFYAIFAVAAFLRTRSYGYLISMLYVCSLALFVNTMPIDYLFDYGELPVFSRLIAFVTLFFMVWVLLLLVTGRTRWRGRDLFELAALDVEEVTDGYTARPHPTGKINGSKDQILGFSEFLKRNLITMSFIEQDRVVLLPVMMGTEFQYLFRNISNDYNKSWISIDFRGNMTVHIARKDYLRFRENLSFDQLCENMGHIFIDFFDMYTRGDSVRIMDRLNRLHIGIF